MLSRRDLLVAPALAAAPKLWIDPKLAAASTGRPWRKVHLDFHNTPHIPSIGEKFNPVEFAQTLTQARVDSIVVFAKDMHGYFYYPSKYGPVHPGLKLDLLGAQVETCRKNNIAVYGYYCTTWDHYLAERHPEWLASRRDRTTHLPKFNETPGWTALCIAHPGFVDLVVEHTREFMSRYHLDGAWYDMPVPKDRQCYCGRCLDEMRRAGLDPMNLVHQARHKQLLEIAFQSKLTAAVKQTRPGAHVDYNGQASYGLSQRAPYQDNIDLEALPTAGQWGYYYFPLTVRYARANGLTTYGMTGRFLAAWADFGGLKHPAQLQVECASIVANCARCDIGDQMPPSGRLDPAVYHVIGETYRRIQRIEPYLEGASPVSEAALLVQGEPLEWPNNDSHLGWTKLLLESRIQFDVCEPVHQWERYGLVILPETLTIDAPLAARLSAYLQQGGAVIAAATQGEMDWLKPSGLSYRKVSPFKPAYILPNPDLTPGIPPYEYALYEGASEWEAAAPAQVLAKLGEPLFQRSPERFTSHAQTPFDHATPLSAIAVSGRLAHFAFPLGESYFRRGYWLYRQLFQKTLPRIITAVISSSAPINVEIALTHQPKQNRYLLHLVNWSPLRGTPRHPVFHEEPVPIHDIKVTLRLPSPVKRAHAVELNRDLFISAGGEITLPLLTIHEIIALT